MAENTISPKSEWRTIALEGKILAKAGTYVFQVDKVCRDDSANGGGNIVFWLRVIGSAEKGKVAQFWTSDPAPEDWRASSVLRNWVSIITQTPETDLASKCPEDCVKGLFWGEVVVRTSRKGYPYPYVAAIRPFEPAVIPEEGHQPVP